MSLLNFNGAPFSDSLIGSTNELISQPNLVHQEGSGKGKKKVIKPKKTTLSKKKTVLKKKKPVVKKTVSKKKKTTVKKTVPKKKVMDKWTKEQLEKLAKKHGIKLSTREGKRRTKSQLYRSLKRKKLI